MENVVGLIIADSPTNGGGNNVVEDQVRRLGSKGSTPKNSKSAKRSRHLEESAEGSYSSKTSKDAKGELSGKASPPKKRGKSTSA